MNGLNLTHAVLPLAVVLPLWVKLSWALVFSAVALRLTSRWPAAVWVGVVAWALLWLPLPGVGVLSGYLALAFQTPSLVLVAWAVWCWVDVLQSQPPQCTTPTLVAWVGVVLGWLLVLDTLNLWPAFFNPQLYAFGFEAAGLWLVLALAAAAMVWASAPPRWTLTAVAVLAVYAGLRLPTGNVWDALLDPFVWLALHVQVWRAVRTHR